MSTIRSLEDAGLVIFNYITHEVSPLQRGKIEKSLLDYVETNPENIPTLAEYATTMLKGSFLVESAVHYIDIFSLLKSFEKPKYLPIIFKALQFIDSKRRLYQFKYAIKRASQFIEGKDIPQNSPLSSYILLKYIKVEDEQLLKKLAEGYAEAFTKVTDVHLPSFIFSREVAAKFPRQLFIDVIVARFDRQLLRNGAKFYPFACKALPSCFELSPTQKSLIYAITESIVKAKADDRNNFIKFFKQCVRAYNQDELCKMVFEFLSKNTGFDQKNALTSLLSYLNLNIVSEDSLNLVFNMIKTEKQNEVKNNLIICLQSCSEKAVDFLVSLPAEANTFKSVIDVLILSSSPKAIEYARNNYAIAPMPAACLILRKGGELTENEIKELSQPSKFQADKFEVLLRMGHIELAMEQFVVGSQLYINCFDKIDPKFVAPFISAVIDNEAVSDKVILQFQPYVMKNKAFIDDRKVLSIVCPQLAQSSDSKLLVSYLPKRPHLAQPALEFIGLTPEQFQLVQNAIKEYTNNPLSEEDEHLLLCKENIDTEHPTAEQYNQMKDEIKHPNAKTNLPQLKKRFEKQTEKTIEKQKELKEQIRETKIIPVKSALHLLKSHFLKSPKIGASLTSFTPQLLKMRELEIFREDVDDLLLAAFNRIDAYRATPKMILSIITSDQEELDDYFLAKLVPAKLTDVLLHVISTRLPELLSNKDLCDSFCDVSAITQEADVETLLPIYIDHANIKDTIYNFAVALAKGADPTRLKAAFDNILFPNEKIRECAIDCINASNITTAYITPELMCQIIVHTASHPSAVELIERLEPPRPETKELLAIFNKIFNLKVKDEALIRDIGTSFGVLMLDDVDTAVDFLISLYNANTQETESFLISQQESVRAAISYSLLELKPLSQKCISFITTTALKDTVPTVRNNIMEVCKYYLDSFDEEERLNMYNSFFSLLNLPPVSNVENNRLRINLIELCTMVIKTQPSLVEPFMTCLMKYNIRSPDEEVREICAKTISTFAKKNPTTIDGFINTLLEDVDKIKGTERLLGFAYTYVAFLNAQGISSLKNRNVFDFTDELAKNKDPNKRALCAYIFAALSFMFRSMIEPSLPRILPVLLTLFGDPNEEVRSASDRASQSIVKNLTKACGERVLPYALKIIDDDDNWRTQHAAILLVSSVIKGGTKNIQKFIPNIVSVLSKSMKSANTTIKHASTEALELLRGLITNEAIIDLFPFLIQALTNFSKLDIAIDKIAHLNLKSLLDASSLSLIVPIVSNACRSTNVNIKSSAIKIIGHLPTISIQGTLDSFSDDLIDPLIAMIADASPSVRALASSSLSSIIVVLPSSVYDSVMDRLLKDMINKTNFAERQGYAMSIASLIKTRGVEQLNAQLLGFVELARNDKDINIRECYVSLLGFLSHFFGADEFQSSYDITIDAVLEACSDTNDAIRTVGLRSASLIAKTFALSHPDLILNPYFSCALKENWRFRLCAVNFMKAFVLACTGTTEADDKGIRNIGELLDKLSQALRPEILYPTLMTLFILTNDPVQTVKSEASAVWRQIIPNTGAFLRQDLGILMDRIVAFVSSESEVVRAVGAFAMGEAVRKLRTRFLIMCLDKIDELLNVEDIDVNHGALMCIHALNDQMTQDYKLRACTQLAPFLSSPYDFIRNEAIETFVQMRQSLGEEGARQVSAELIKYVFRRAESPDDISSLAGLLGIIGQHPMVTLTYDILKRPLNDDRPRVAGKLIAVCGSALDPIMPNFADRIISICAHPPCEEEGVIALKIAGEIVKVLNEEHLNILTIRLVENMRSQQPQNRLASIKIGAMVLDRVGQHFTEIAKQIIRAALYLFDDPLDNIMNSAVTAVQTAGERIDNSEITQMVSEIADDFDSICSATKVRAFKDADAFEALDSLIQKALSSDDVNAVFRAASLLATVVPQLARPPSSIRKLLALIVRCFQLINQTDVLAQLLRASRALFEKASSERQMLVNSLPTAYLRLFRENDRNLHQEAADALCSFAERVSTPALVVRLFLQVLRLQGSHTSATLLNSVIRTVSKLKLSDSECRECITLLTPHLNHSLAPMRELAAQAIATTLLSSSLQELERTISDTKVISMDTPQSMHTSTVILSEFMKSPSKEVIDLVMPKVLDVLPVLEQEEDSNVSLAFSKLVVSVVIVQPARLQEMIPYIINLIENGDVQHQVVACQSLQRLSVLKPSLWKKSQPEILDVLLSAYRFGEEALQSAAAVALFVLFRLEELSVKETEALAEIAGDVEHTIDDFNAIVQQCQTDRANQRQGKA